MNIPRGYQRIPHSQDPLQSRLRRSLGGTAANRWFAGASLQASLTPSPTATEGIILRGGALHKVVLDLDVTEVVDAVDRTQHTLEVLPAALLNSSIRRCRDSIQAATPVGPPRDKTSSAQSAFILGAHQRARAVFVATGDYKNQRRATIDFLKRGNFYRGNVTAEARNLANDVRKLYSAAMSSSFSFQEKQYFEAKQAAGETPAAFSKRMTRAHMQRQAGTSRRYIHGRGWDWTAIEGPREGEVGSLVDSIMVEVNANYGQAVLEATSLSPYASMVEEGFMHTYQPTIALKDSTIEFWVPNTQLGAYQWVTQFLAAQSELGIDNIKNILGFKPRMNPKMQPGVHFLQKGWDAFLLEEDTLLRFSAARAIGNTWNQAIRYRSGVRGVARARVPMGQYKAGQFVPRIYL